MVEPAMPPSPNPQKVTITKHWSWLPAVSVDVDCDPAAPPGIKLGLAVRMAYEKNADLRGGDLRGAELKDAILQGADLDDADLERANLEGANLDEANLRGADLQGANLRGANFRQALLRDADLRGADIQGATFQGAVLQNAALDGVVVQGDWTMPDGLRWSEYLRDVVPALLTAGGKTLKQLRASGCWDCHGWDNCPLHVAFGISDTAELTGQRAIYRAQADQFVRFFDARLIPPPWGKEPDKVVHLKRVNLERR